jgi:uncharacterized membrane protein
MTKASNALQFAATLLLGVMAGFFFAFSFDVAPAMRTLDAATYIPTQQAINSTVRNVPFAIAYFGSAFVPLLAAIALWLAGRKRMAIAWLVLGIVYLAGVFVLTREINIPINNAMAQWNPLAPPAGWDTMRDDWNAANLVRCVVACLSFAAALALSQVRPARGES